MASTRYAPAESVVVLRVSEVSWLTTVTSAPGTTAPVGSRTTPTRIPLLVCAFRTGAQNRSASDRRANAIRTCSLLINFLPSTHAGLARVGTDRVFYIACLLRKEAIGSPNEIVTKQQKEGRAVAGEPWMNGNFCPV